MADASVTSAQVTLPPTGAAAAAGDVGPELADDVYRGWTVLQRAINRTLVGSLQQAERLNEETRRQLARIA